MENERAVQRIRGGAGASRRARFPCIAAAAITAALALTAAGCGDPMPEREPGLTEGALGGQEEPADVVEARAGQPPDARDMRIPRSEAAGPTGEWRLPALDYANSRFSELDQIDTGNVGQLEMVMNMSTGVLRGHEGQPLVVDQTMYVVTPFPNHLIAVDLTRPGGAVKWTYAPNPDPRSVGVACCDVVNRGAVYADGKIIYTMLDAHAVAVNAQNGKEVWRTRIGDIGRGETTTMAPLVVKDKVLIGNSGADLGVRGKVVGLDLETGEEVWRVYNTGPDEEVGIGPDFRPFYEKDRGEDLGVKSWPTDEWKLGGSTVWGWLSYDPELDLFYYGTANPGVWNPDMRPGDNKWSLTIFARDPDDGSARWAYQLIPHEAWDYDEIMENILVDMSWQGEMRRLLIHPGRTGFVYILDRATGELLSAEKFARANWAEGYDLETGLPLVNEEKRTHQGVVTRNICPSSTGAKEVIPSAISPRTGLLYIPAMNVCMDYEGIEANYIAGTPYVGASIMMYPGPGDHRGELIAWDPIEERKVWGAEEEFPLYSGVLATAGDVVFYGTMDGWFKAVDARDGTELWRFKTGSGIVGNPMTYLGPDGRQYVAIYSGIGGWMGAAAFPALSADDPYTALGIMGAVGDLKKVTRPGGTVYVFGLGQLDGGAGSRRPVESTEGADGPARNEQE